MGRRPVGRLLARQTGDNALLAEEAVVTDPPRALRATKTQISKIKIKIIKRQERNRKRKYEGRRGREGNTRSSCRGSSQGRRLRDTGR